MPENSWLCPRVHDISASSNFQNMMNEFLKRVRNRYHTNFTTSGETGTQSLVFVAQFSKFVKILLLSFSVYSVTWRLI